MLIVIRTFILSLNLWLLLNGLTEIKYLKYIKHYIDSFTLGLFIPGQVGDASLAYFLKKKGIPYNKGGLVYFLDKFISVLILFTIAYIGTIILLEKLNSVIFLMIPIIIIIIIVILIQIILKVDIRLPYYQKIKTGLQNTLVSLKEFKKKWHLLIINIFLTVINWTILALIYYIVFYSLGANLPFPEVGIIPIISSLVAYIPISIGGIGTVEFAAIELFSMIGAAEQTVLSTYLIIRLFIYLSTAILFFIFTYNHRKMIYVPNKKKL